MTRFAKIPPGGLDREGFLAHYAAVYEHSPWIAGAVWDEGAASDNVEALAKAMAARVEAAGEAAHWRCSGPTPISPESWRLAEN